MEETAGLLNFSVSGLIAGLIFGVVGLWLFREGRKSLNHKVMVIGLVMMIYPYFTNGPWMDWGIGFGLSGLAYYLW